MYLLTAILKSFNVKCPYIYGYIQKGHRVFFLNARARALASNLCPSSVLFPLYYKTRQPLMLFHN